MLSLKKKDDNIHKREALKKTLTLMCKNSMSKILMHKSKQNCK